MLEVLLLPPPPPPPPEVDDELLGSALLANGTRDIIVDYVQCHAKTASERKDVEKGI